MGQTKEIFEKEREGAEAPLFPPPAKEDLQVYVDRVIKAPTQATIQQVSNDIVDLVKEGITDPLRLVVMMKAMTEVFENVRKNITTDVLDELQKYTKDELAESLGAKLERMEAGVSYDYSQCGDTGWQILNSQLEGIKTSMKERETFLKTIKNPIQIADELTGGESVTVHPAIRKSTSTFKIHLAK